MSQPKGQCPICEKTIQPADDAVVCPECGTPYHRACYQNAGGCVHAEKHGTGYEYRDSATAASAESSPGPGDTGAYDATTMACPACGRQNDTRNIFCNSCGKPLHRQGPEGYPKDSGGANGPGVGGMPFGAGGVAAGVDLSGTIDDIPKKDWGVYVGQSAPVYITRLSAQDARGTKLGFMFSAFLVPHLYFAYRKQWLWAALTTVLTLVLQIPQYLAVLMEKGDTVLGFDLAFMTNLSNVFNIAYILMCFLCGVFALTLYRRGAGRQMKKLREKFTNEADYQAALQREGGVSWLGVIAVGLAMSIIFSTVLMYAVPGAINSYFMLPT